MILFLTSNIGGYKKDNGVKVATSFFSDNDFIDNLKKYITRYNKFVLISSDPNSYEKNDKYLKIDKEALKLSGLEFRKYIVLDNRNKDSIGNILNNCNLIFLSGGDTLIQNKFFNEINLKDYLKNINSVIVGISAGSINCATNAYNSPESDNDLINSPYLKGLELTDINIEPHFILNINNNDYNKNLQRKEILKESYNRELIGLPDKSYIIEKDNDVNIYGDAYSIKNGNINKINNNFIL